MSSRAQSQAGPGPWVMGCLLLIAALWLAPSRILAAASDIETARKAFEKGQYDLSIRQAEEALKAQESTEDWGTLLAQALLIRGRYSEALSSVTNSLAADPRSVRLQWMLHEALLANGKPEAADQTISEIHRLFSGQSWRYRNARSLVAFGRAALTSGLEPKLALDRIFEAAKRSDPLCPDPYIASGELALEKHDFALAARFYQEGLKQLPEHPEMLLGLAKAYAPSNHRLMLRYLGEALEQNTNHVASLLLMADYEIDAEDYSEAEKLISRVDAVNPAHPEAWAYRAVIAHLRNQPEIEAKARATALKFWPMNPRVDHLIGLKLSQKYRFAEGARHQKLALAYSPGYLPAKAQLSQDLLRLGHEDEGWRMADEVQQADAYDVAANNLVTLRDVLAKYRTLTNEHFALHMHPREASIYGERALTLLERARQKLAPEYGVEFTRPVLVEMFSEEKDFAVRTFGLPENDGFLGVCFGHVITANSPGAKPGGQFNWESMLWHEFCHVITLQLTRNKMPRWLSEGISVYEERQANPAWGEQITPRYREMLLGEELTPVSKLSGAFLAPKSGLHLQFAYYQSSLVVEYLIDRFGREKLLQILRDLGDGVEPNAALARHTAPMPELEEGFEAYARQVAHQMAPGVDWERPTPPPRRGLASVLERLNSPEADATPEPAEVSESTWEAWAKSRPTNYWVMSRQAQNLADEGRWEEAKPLLRKLVELYPGATGPTSPYLTLAMAHRQTGQTNEEARVLSALAARDDEAPEVYARLMELASEKQDWPAALTNAQRYLAVNPLVPLPYRHLARSTEALGAADQAIQAYQALLQLDPPNPADVHYHLAKLLHQQGSPEARRHVLQALEEAPRFREALLLLKEIREKPLRAASRNVESSP